MVSLHPCRKAWLPGFQACYGPRRVNLWGHAPSLEAHAGDGGCTERRGRGGYDPGQRRVRSGLAMKTVPTRTTTVIAELRLDGGTQPRAELNALIVDEYAEKMGADERFPAVTVFDDGEVRWLADGFHRVAAAKQAGLTTIEADIVQGTRRDAVLYSVGVNATHGLPRTNADKRRAVRTLLTDREWAQWSDREIAIRCAVSHTFVATLRAELSGNGCQIDTTRKAERGGAVYTIQTERIGATQKLAPDGLSRESRTPHVAHNSGQIEWFTPPEIIEAARVVMGGTIDLDPASCAVANEVVQATRFYTVEDNGLEREWAGNVWLNPPFAQPWMTQFAAKALTEVLAGRAVQLIAFTNNATETAWAERLLRVASGVCFPTRRVKCWSPDPDRTTSSPLQGQMILYFGAHPEPFVEHFAPVGPTSLWSPGPPGLPSVVEPEANE